jgi:hypothetical protein
VEHASGVHLPPAYKNDFNNTVKGMEPLLRAKAESGIQRASDIVDQAKAKAAEVAKSTLEKIHKDERGGTFPS